MALLRQIQQLFIDIRAWLREIKNAIQEQSKAGHDPEEVQRGHNLPREKICAVISFDDETVSNANSQFEKQYTTQEGIRKATVAAGVAAGIYALISLLIWRQMIKQNKIASSALTQSTKSFRIDERAWMGFKFTEGSINFTFNKSFLVPTQVINTGKTPAKNVHGNIVVGVFQKGEPLDFTYTQGHAHYFVQ